MREIGERLRAPTISSPLVGAPELARCAIHLLGLPGRNFGRHKGCGSVALASLRGGLSFDCLGGTDKPLERQARWRADTLASAYG